jgi:pimeloyl-ACP methyl ester carboxylesterase
MVAAADEPHVLLLPGSVLPAELAYGALTAALAERADAVAKDLEVYATDEPPLGYSLDTEIDGVLREADQRGWARFHLVGYSGGGAVALAVAARDPERLLSLALLEPAWAGNSDLSTAEQELWKQYDELIGLPHEQFMPAFMRLNLRAGVEPPERPDGPPPDWMRKRPAGINAFMTTFKTYSLDPDALRRFEQPVYFALGGLSNPDQYGEIAERLAGVFPDFTLEVFEERHHFDPPHRIEPERVAQSLLRTWARTHD